MSLKNIIRPQDVLLLNTSVGAELVDMKIFDVLMKELEIIRQKLADAELTPEELDEIESF